MEEEIQYPFLIDPLMEKMSIGLKMAFPNYIVPFLTKEQVEAILLVWGKVQESGGGFSIDEATAIRLEIEERWKQRRKAEETKKMIERGKNKAE